MYFISQRSEFSIAVWSVCWYSKRFRIATKELLYATFYFYSVHLTAPTEFCDLLHKMHETIKDRTH